MWQIINGQVVDYPHLIGQPIGQPVPAQFGAQQANPYAQHQLPQQQPSALGANAGAAKGYSNIIQVYGESGAWNYPLPNNSRVVMHDNEKDIEYHVTVDETGKRSVVLLDLCAHKEEPKPDFNQFVTKDEFAKVRKEIAEMREKRSTDKLED